MRGTETVDLLMFIGPCIIVIDEEQKTTVKAGPVPARFVDKAVLGQAVTRAFQLFPVSIMSSIPHSVSS